MRGIEVARSIGRPPPRMNFFPAARSAVFDLGVRSSPPEKSPVRRVGRGERAALDSARSLVQLWHAPLAGAPWAGVPVVGAPLAGAPWAGVPVVGAPLAGAPWAGVPVVGAPLAGAALAEAPSVGTPLAGVQLMAALLVGPPMVGAPEPGLSSSLPWVLVVVLVVVAVVVTVVAV